MTFGDTKEDVIERSDYPKEKLQAIFKDDTFAVLGYGVQVSGMGGAGARKGKRSPGWSVSEEAGSEPRTVDGRFESSSMAVRSVPCAGCVKVSLAPKRAVSVLSVFCFWTGPFLFGPFWEFLKSC